MNWKLWNRRARKVRSHPHPVRFLISRALWKTGLSPLWTIDLPEGQRIRFYPSSISAALWVSANARNDDVEFLKLVLRQGDTYVDCGANVGHLAVIARSITGTDGAVTAIEANPRIFQFCVGNLRLNGFADVLALNVALGESRGTVSIGDRHDDDQNRIGEGATLVPMRPLDDVIGSGPITLLKLDVEGYELSVLRGGSRTLSKTNIVYCELSTSNCARFGYLPSDVEDLLLDAGFVFARRRTDAWSILRHRLYSTLENDEQPTTGYNLVAIRPGAIEDFKSRLAAHGQTIVDPM